MKLFPLFVEVPAVPVDCWVLQWSCHGESVSLYHKESVPRGGVRSTERSALVDPLGDYVTAAVHSPASVAV